MRVMLLAAGRSTRLGAIGAALPKPLVPVCGYPAIRFGVEACRRAGLVDLVVNVHHLGERIRAVLGDGAALGVRVSYSDESAELLGTGGGLVHARALLGVGAVLVMNAKVVADVDLRAVVEAHRASGAVATMVVRDVPDPRRWGAIASDDAGCVVGILDARAPGTFSGAVHERMFTGIHVVEPRLLARLSASGVSDVIRDAYLPALAAGERIASVVLPGYFAEHSTPERYLEGNLGLLDRPGLVPHPPGPLVGVDPGATVHARARLVTPVRIAAGAVVEADAVVERSVVAGRVAAGAIVRDAVVWPGATAVGEIVRGVVTPDGVVICA